MTTRELIQIALFDWIKAHTEPQIGKNIEGYPTYAFSAENRGLIISFKANSVLALIRDGQDLREDVLSCVEDLNQKLLWVMA